MREWLTALTVGSLLIGISGCGNVPNPAQNPGGAVKQTTKNTASTVNKAGLATKKVGQNAANSTKKVVPGKS